MPDVDNLLVSIRRIIRAIDLHSKKLSKTAGLTVPQLLVMRAVRGEEKKSTREIASEISLSQATVTTIIDRLERAGLIDRRRNEADRRLVTISLTSSGLEKLKSAPDPLQENFVRRFAELDSWEQQMLSASLARVAHMMDAETIDAAPILTPGDVAKYDAT